MTNGLEALILARCPSRDATSSRTGVAGRNRFPGFPSVTALIPLLALLVATLVGCSAITRPAPVRQTFLLEAPAPAVVAQPRSGSLRVGAVIVASPFRGKNFVYRTSDLRYETDFYVEYFVTPGAMLTEQTARALERSRPFEKVAGPGMSIDADCVLDGFASALYADARDAAKPAAELAITYYLTTNGGLDQTPFWSHEYRERVPMREPSSTAYAEALNTAFGSIIDALSRDLASVQLPQH